MSVFTPGMPSSTELRLLAEEGDSSALATMLHGYPMAMGNGLLMPGMSMELTINGGSMNRYLSLAAMMIPTNDGFVGAWIELPSTPEPMYVYAYAYDAGTEINDELCSSLPGPHPECDRTEGDGHVAVGGGEGHIAIHRGIQGVGDFAGDRDWRNPVAMVTVQRIS